MHVALGLLLAIASVPDDAPLWFTPPAPGRIIRHFEPPPTPYQAGHRGIDIAVPSGTAIRASERGIVFFAGPVGGSLYVSIDHPGGIRTTYSYLSVIDVDEGAAVARGDVIGRSGRGHPNSGRPHLHFGMRRGDDYLDPEPYLVAALRHDYSGVIRLVPLKEPDDGGGSSMPAALPALLAGGCVVRARKALVP